MTTATADTKALEAPSPVRPVPPAAPPSPAAPTAQPARSPQGRGKRAFVVLGAFVVVALLGYGVFMLATRGKVSTDDAQVEADVVPVAARVSGPVVAVAVVDNQRVKKGDTILRIDDADYVARVKQAEADLEQARAQADQAESQEQIVAATAKGGMSSAQASVWGSSANVQTADAQTAAAEAALERAQVEAQHADTELARSKELRAGNAIPQAQLDASQTTAAAAHAALTQAQANLTAAREAKRAAVTHVAEAQGRLTQTAPIEAQIRAAHAATDLAHAKVAANEAALALAKLQLSYTAVVAPDSGSISRLMAHPGQLLSPGSPIGELVPEKTYVVANFKETQIGDMRPGQTADVSIDAFGARTFAGKVESLSAGTGARFSMLPADNASGNFVKVVQRVPVRIELTGVPADVVLRAGLSADVTVHVK
jgi:membrane fusion protein (multidrug efflux system)